MNVLVSLANLPQILITWVVFFGAAGLFLAAGLWANRGNFSTGAFLANCFPFNIFRSNSARLDVKVYVLSKLTDALWGAPGALLSTALSLGVLDLLIQIDSGAERTSGYAMIALIGVFLFLVGELADFTIHYCEHKVPVLWELHKVHHSASTLNPLTSQRVHPISIVLGGIVRGIFFCIPAGAAMHFAGLSLVEIIAARALTTKAFALLTLDPLRHSPYPVGFGWLDRLFISPHMHQIHHSSLQPHWDRNFGTNLSIFDWIFRTGYKPFKNEPVVLGLYGYEASDLAKYQTIYGAYVRPLVKAWLKIMPNRVMADGTSPDRKKDGVIPA